MPTIENYLKAICRLKRHYVEALCKVETISPPGRPFTLEMLDDRRTVAAALRVAISKLTAITTLLANEVSAGNGESTEPSSEITDAVGEFFACILTGENSVHFATLDAFGNQLEDRTPLAYTFGIRLINHTGEKQDACLRYIGVAVTGMVIDVPTGTGCKFSHEGPYTSDFPWSNTPANTATGIPGIAAVRGCTNSLSQYDTESNASQLRAWTEKRLCCVTTDEEWDTVLNQKDVIYALFREEACNVCKVTLRQLPEDLTGWKLEYTDRSNPELTKTVNLDEVDPDLIVNGVYCDYLSARWAEAIDLKITAGNGQGLPGSNPVTIANPSKCENRLSWDTECLKIAFKPELEFIPYFVNCEPELVASPLNTLTPEGEPICDKYTFNLPEVTTEPEGLQVTVTIVAAPEGCPGSGPVIYSGPPGVQLTLPFGTYCATYSATDDCDTATCEQLITVKDVVGPNVIGINGLAVNLVGEIVDGTVVPQVTVPAVAFETFTTDNCTPRDELDFKIKRSNSGDEPADTIKLTCDDPETLAVELHVTDNAGNTTVVETYILVQDKDTLCPLS